MNKDNKQLLYNIDKAIKRCREIENNKFPYAVTINIETNNELGIGAFTYLSKQGFKSIPILNNKTIKKNNFKLVYTEEELIN